MRFIDPRKIRRIKNVEKERTKQGVEIVKQVDEFYLYNDKGIKIFVSAFGATQHPTTAGSDPIQCATKLSNFVLNNNLDGVDINWEDNRAMPAGKG